MLEFLPLALDLNQAIIQAKVHLVDFVGLASFASCMLWFFGKSVPPGVEMFVRGMRRIRRAFRNSQRQPQKRRNGKKRAFG
jgi:hypothetical protein